MPSDEKPGGVPDRKPLTPEEQAELDARLSARLASHSGMPEVTTSEWALLIRAAGDKPVPLEEIISTFIHWFSPVLSTAEIEKTMHRCLDMGWLETVMSDEGVPDLHTTALGRAVIEAVRRPMFLAGIFGLAEAKGVLNELGGLPGIPGTPPPSPPTDRSREGKHDDV